MCTVTMHSVLYRKHIVLWSQRQLVALFVCLFDLMTQIHALYITMWKWEMMFLCTCSLNRYFLLCTCGFEHCRPTGCKNDFCNWSSIWGTMARINALVVFHAIGRKQNPRCLTRLRPARVLWNMQTRCYLRISQSKVINVDLVLRSINS